MTQVVVPSFSNSSFAAVATPEAILVEERGTELRVTLATGENFKLGAIRLRMACRCAKCTRARIDGVFPDNFDDIRITQCAPMGHYGINIVFSDGHARGIFPWSYLADLAVCTAP